MTWILLIYFISVTKYLEGNSENLTIGLSVDVLKSYGVIGRLVRDKDTALRSTLLYNVFKDKLCLNETADSYVERSENNGTWTIKYYEDKELLLNDFFRNYNIEFVDCCLCALTPNIGVKRLATFLGVKDTNLARNNAFVVVKYEKPVFRCAIKENRLENIQLNPSLLERLKNVTQHFEDQTETLNFISNYGSHFISSLTTGEIIYQVFAFPRTVAMIHKQESKNEDELKRKLLENGMSSSEAGEIRTLSGNKELEEILNTELRINNHNNRIKSSNLLILYNNINNNTEGGGGNNSNNIISHYSHFLKFSSILQFNLTSISNVIHDKQLAYHFKEILDNQVKLRELYL